VEEVWSRHLSALCAVPVELTAPLLSSVRSHGLLVACKAAGLKWPTVHAVQQSPVVPHGTDPEFAEAKSDYLRLSQASAQRTLRFWKVRVGSTKSAAG
jgi:Uncharacterised protein conserved in bacteria (DUF2336)